MLCFPMFFIFRLNFAKNFEMLYCRISPDLIVVSLRSVIASFRDMGKLKLTKVS